MSTSDPTRTNRTIYIGGLPRALGEDALLEAFSAFGEVLDVQVPRGGGAGGGGPRDDARSQGQAEAEAGAGPEEGGEGARRPHRGFGFLVFSSEDEAMDAIDNMHLNELGGRILNVNIAKPLKTSLGGGNRPVWEDEEWIKKYAKPIGQAAGEGHEEEGEGEGGDREMEG